MEVINLTKVNFLYAYINKLLEQKINYISKDEVEKDFYNVMRNYRYNIQLNLDEIHEKSFDFSLEFKIFVQVGYIYHSATNSDKYYIINTKKINKNNELSIIVDDLFEIKEISKKYQNCQITITDPNGNYNLTNENINDTSIEWNLITDGIQKDHYLKVIDDLQSDEKLKINITNVSDATFVVKQGIINNQVFSSNLYTKIIDTYLLDEIAKQYCKKR